MKVLVIRCNQNESDRIDIESVAITARQSEKNKSGLNLAFSL